MKVVEKKNVCGVIWLFNLVHKYSLITDLCKLSIETYLKKLRIDKSSTHNYFDYSVEFPFHQ